MSIVKCILDDCVSMKLKSYTVVIGYSLHHHGSLCSFKTNANEDSDDTDTDDEGNIDWFGWIY